MRRVICRNAALAIALAAMASMWPHGVSLAQSKPVIGRVEKVRIEGPGVVLRAKIDTGARTTSLNARNIIVFRRNGTDRVRFSFDDDAGKSVTLDRKLVRVARLKDNPRGGETRPVVMLRICVGEVSQLTQVNLVDRSKFEYRLLIGRRFIHGRFLVDTAKTYVAEPRCRGTAAP